MEKEKELTTTKQKDGVQKMFNSIAGKYDFLNRFFSFGIDVYWRKRLIKLLISENPKQILDVATGTADLAIMAANKDIPKITGVDISEKMLEIGSKKVEKKKLSEIITLLHADALNLPFPESYFDAVCISFGVRNFQNTQNGLKEMFRVLKPGKTLYILEFSQVHSFPLKQLYHFYSNGLMPMVGGIIGNNRKAYKYLLKTAKEFPSGDAFLKLLKEAGFSTVSSQRLSGGIVEIYQAKK